MGGGRGARGGGVGRAGSGVDGHVGDMGGKPEHPIGPVDDNLDDRRHHARADRRRALPRRDIRLGDHLWQPCTLASKTGVATPDKPRFYTSVQGTSQSGRRAENP